MVTTPPPPLPVLTPESLAFLRSAGGAALLTAATELIDDPFAAEKLRRRGGCRPEHAAAAIEQVRLRRRAAARFSRASEMWFAPSLLEQASGEEVSRHRARRYAGREFVGDLCCGLGGDTVSLAQHAEVLAMDRDPLALALTAANAGEPAIAGPNHSENENSTDKSGQKRKRGGLPPRCRVETRQGTVPGDVPALPAAWVDPGRREDGARTRRLDRMSPSLAEVLSLRDRIPALGVKLSPASDDTQLDSLVGRIPNEREFVSVRGECRELALWLDGLAESPGTRRATLLPSGETLCGRPVPLAEPARAGEWLLEPDAAVIRAGLVGNLAERLGAAPVDPRLAYLSLERPAATPFGSLYRVREAEPFSGKALARRLRELEAADVVLKTRGTAARPELLRQQLRGVLKQGRPGSCPVVFITRLGDRAVMILGERVGAGTTVQDA